MNLLEDGVHQIYSLYDTVRICTKGVYALPPFVHRLLLVDPVDCHNPMGFASPNAVANSKQFLLDYTFYDEIKNLQKDEPVKL